MKNWKHIGYRNKMIKETDRIIVFPKNCFNPEELKKKRSDLGITQRDLATALCVSVRTVISWETGTRTMPLCCQRLFCMLYGLPFDVPKAPIDDLTPDLF